MGGGGVNESDALQHSRLSIILENQLQLEKSVHKMIGQEGEEKYPDWRTEATPPAPAPNFQTPRLLLSHLGLLHFQDGSGLFEERENPVWRPTTLQTIQSEDENFLSALDSLDKMCSRTTDTIHLFYVRAGQKSPKDILANPMSRGTVSSGFLEFIRSLGWPATPQQQQKNHKHTEKLQGTDDDGGSIFNGHQLILFWSDVLSELSFVVPSLQTPPTDGVSQCKADWNIFVAWLERFEDSFNFPAEEFAKEHIYCGDKDGDCGGLNREPPILIIFVHALQSGLFRISLQGPTHRMGLATPLVDGMVVSRRVLGPLVRQTAQNMFRRKRLESESFQSPHIRRKLKIQELGNRFSKEMSCSEHFTGLF